MSKRLGLISLGISATGFAGCQLLIHQGILADRWWSVLSAGFEAGTIGGMADWFAVTALFREVPIPWLRRHTNIIIKHRARFTKALQDYVQHTLLTPAVIKEQLREVAFAKGILAILAQDRHREQVTRICRELLIKILKDLDHAPLVSALETHARASLAGADIAKPVADWIDGLIAKNDHLRLWQVALERGQLVLRDDGTRNELAVILKEAIRDYAKSGVAAQILVWVSNALSVTDYERFAEAILGRGCAWIEAVQADPEHPFRMRTQATILAFTQDLRDKQAQPLAALEDVRHAFLASVDFTGLISQALDDLIQRTSAALGDPASALSTTLARQLDTLLHSLQDDQPVQDLVDAHLRTVIADFIENNHHVVGSMVATSLAPSRVADRALVDQIEDKVGDDLQYIRLNGAVVGGMVGVALGIIKVLGG